MNKKEGVLLLVFVCLLVGVIFFSGCDCSVPSEISRCSGSGENKVFVDDGRSFLCLNNGGYAACVKKVSPKGIEEYCTTDDIKSQVASKVSTYGVKTQDVLDAWETGTISITEEASPEETESEATTDEVMNNIKNSLTSDKGFPLLNIGSLSIKTKCGDFDNMFILNCDSSTKDTFYIWDETFELDPKNPNFSIFHCTIDPNTGSLRWIGKEDMLKRYDSDKDGVPHWFDCDDNDPDVYGNFWLFGGKEPVQICGDGKNNTCGVVENENDECDQNAHACQNNCLYAGGNCNWLEGAQGKNNCCGDDGLEDLAKTEKSASGNFLCLSNKESLVGHAHQGDPIGWNEDCEGEWCWIWATGGGKAGNPEFKIYTINKPGENPYDVVSNNDEWKICSAGEEGVLIPDKYGEYTGKADKFYCYQEGNRWSWAECCSETTSCEGNGFKERKPGDGAYNLASKVDGDRIILSKNQDYLNFYGENYLSFNGYDYLEFYFRFTEEQVSLPARMMVEIWSEKGKVFSEDAFSYVINGPRFEPNKTMHVQIPISPWAQVSMIFFRTDSNNISITNVQLAKKSGDNPICSGSKWLNDFDDLEGEKMCTALGMTWLGKDADREYRCCGDDSQEYYASDKAKAGCWNSEGAAVNQTVMDVEVEMSYGLGEWGFGYDEKNVSASVDVTALNLNLATDYYFKCPNLSGQYCYPGQYNCVVSSRFFGGNQDFCTGEIKDKKDTCNYLYTTDKGEWVYSTDQYGSSTSIYVYIDEVRQAVCSEGPYDNQTNQLRTDLKEIGGQYYSEKEVPTDSNIFSGEVNYATSPEKIGNVTLIKQGFVKAEVKDQKNGKVYLLDPLNPEEQLTVIYPSDLKQSKTTFYVMAEVDQINRNYTYKTIKENLTYTCFGDTCQYPLKGSPPYTIKNLHPEKYDLYWVNLVDNREIRVLIDKEKIIYANRGWLEVKNVPQQVLFDGSSFVACGNFNSSRAQLVSADFCGVLGGYFCSPLHGWKKDSLAEMRYDDNNVLKASGNTIGPEARNHSTSIVPGRNLLFNPWLELK